MDRFLVAICLSVLLLPGGCNHNPLRRWRDEALLSSPAVATASSSVPVVAAPSSGTAPFLPDLLATSGSGSLPAAVADLQKPYRDGGLALAEALELAMRNSDVVRVSSGSRVEAELDTAFDVQIAEMQIQAALAEFDTSFAAEIYSTRIKRPPNAFFGPGLSQPTLRDEAAFNAGFTKKLLSGAEASVLFNPDPGYLYLPQGNGSSFNPRYVGELQFSLRQPLLRGGGAVNQVPIQISQIQSQQSAWEFKKAVMASVRSIVAAYWELRAARVAVRAIDEVIPLLEEVVRLQQESYRAEWIIYADVAKAQAQLHDFRQRRLELSSEARASELRFRHLLGISPADGWTIVPTTEPATVAVFLEPQDALGQALEHQPDLVRQRLELRIRELETSVARNGRLPNLDFQALYRMNGLGADLGDALSQMTSAEYGDYMLGMTFSVPLGRRLGDAEVRAAELQIARTSRLLEQEMLGVAYRVSDDMRKIEYAYREYQEAEHRLRAADQWLEGARLRYQHPNPGGAGENWLLQSLNEYLAALRFRTDAATEVAAVLARYNTALVELEETKGTLLAFFDIQLAFDPCRQSRWLPPFEEHPPGSTWEEQSELPLLMSPQPAENLPAPSAPAEPPPGSTTRLVPLPPIGNTVAR